MPVYDELEQKRQSILMFWLTVFWLAAVAYVLCSYYTVDLGGSRLPARWDVIGGYAAVMTAVYLALCVVVQWRWPAGRVLLFAISLLGTVALGFLTVAFVLLFAWVWNWRQCVCLAIGAFAMFRVLRHSALRAPMAYKRT